MQLRTTQVRETIQALSLNLKLSLESLLLSCRLESTMTELAAGIDEAEVGLLEVFPGGVRLQGFAECQHTFLDTRA